MEFICPHVSNTLSWCVVVVWLPPTSPFVVNRVLLTAITNGAFSETPFILKQIFCTDAQRLNAC